jgi:CBS domain-containing protein
MVNRLPRSFAAKVGSTNVLRDLLDVSAEARRRESVLGQDQIWEERPKMRAADVMTTDVVTVGPDASVVEVASRMSAVPGRTLPVIGVDRTCPLRA